MDDAGEGAQELDGEKQMWAGKKPEMSGKLEKASHSGPTDATFGHITLCLRGMAAKERVAGLFNPDNVLDTSRGAGQPRKLAEPGTGGGLALSFGRYSEEAAARRLLRQPNGESASLRVSQLIKTGVRRSTMGERAGMR